MNAPFKFTLTTEVCIPIEQVISVREDGTWEVYSETVPGKGHVTGSMILSAASVSERREIYKLAEVEVARRLQEQADDLAISRATE